MKVDLTALEIDLIGGALYTTILVNKDKAKTTDDKLLLHNMEILFNRWTESDGSGDE